MFKRGCLREKRANQRAYSVQFYTTNMFEVGNEGGWIATPKKNMYTQEIIQNFGKNIGEIWVRDMENVTKRI